MRPCTLLFSQIDAILLPEEQYMKKISILAMALLLLASGSVWAQLSLGGTGAVFADTSQSADEIVALFRQGEGIFYGPLVELGLRNLAIGAAFNWSYYYSDIGGPRKMVDYDINGYLQGHLFSYRAFIDPFFEVGFGRVASDFADSAEDTDSSNPLTASNYFQAGGGLGLNFGNLGIFVKALYAIASDNPVMNTGGYPLAAYPFKPLKVFAGAKFTL